MKRFLAILPCVALVGCYSVPERVSRSYDVPGNYQVVADCAFGKLQADWGWTKADFPSMKKSEFTMTVSEVSLGRVTISANDDAVAHVVHQMPPTVGGHGHDDKVEPIVRSCAQVLAPT